MTTKTLVSTQYINGGDLGEELEIQVEYYWCKAEPDVGMPNYWIEVDGVKWDGNYISLPESLLDNLADDIITESYEEPF